MYNALESIQAFEAGQGKRKEREREAAMKTFGNALSMNDYEGASKIGFGIDPALGMQARQYGESQNALALNKQIAPLVASGDYTGAMTLAAPSGDLDLVTQLQQFKQNATVQQRQEAAFKAEQLAKIATGYEGMAPDQAAARWQQDQIALQQQYGFDPAELAQFDPSDPQDLKDAVLAAQTLADIQAGQRYDAERAYAEKTDTRNFNRGVYEFDTTRADARAAAQAEAEAAAASGTNRKTAEDQNGVLRYLDNGQPVFPGVTAAPAAAKPLIGAESMGRVAAGLGNMRQAVNDLSNLVMPKQEGGQGYAPGYDWGAKWLDASLPFVGDPLARWAGGKDYQKFENAYAAFEAAALPIMSGAAVTDSEAKRALKALRVKIGDSNEAVAAKMQNMQRMVQGLEMAAQGDTSFLQTAIETVDEGGTGGIDTMSDDDLKAALGIE